MGDASGVAVDPEKIRTHATNVESVGRSLSQAVEAAQAVSLPTDAFGKLCAFLPPLFLDSIESEGVTTLRTAQQALTDDASKLRSVAAGFEQVDTTNAANLKSVDANGAR
ncbi:type VII secretion target [Nocardia arthritidis]|nr:type VII secretion target [Nocardia arthritidis]